MNSLILSFTAKVLSPVIALMAAYFLLRGHNAPGGGFIAALIGGAWLVLRFFATARTPTIRFEVLIAAGLITAVLAGLAGFVLGGAFLAGTTGAITLLGVGEVKLASSLLFDLGVFLVVLGVVGGLIQYFGTSSR
jgi:multisubunit Na+/H+ antiporter MnhB subunit